MTAMTAVQNDWGVITSPLTSAQLAKIVPSGDVLQLPVFSYTDVLVYNIPSGVLMSTTDDTYRLRLDRNVTALIWAQIITNWKDLRIVALQLPKVAALLPNATIQLVYRSDSSGTTTTLQQACASFSSQWPYATASSAWPSSWLASPNVHGVVQDPGVAGSVLGLSNSIGYVAYATTKTARGVFKYAVMQNKNGDWLTGAPDLSPAIKAATFGSNNAISFNDSPANGSWPIGGPTYILTRRLNISSISCDAQRELYLFFQWCLTSSLSLQLENYLGFQPLSNTEYLLNQFSSVTCDGVSDLAIETTLQHQGSTTTGFFVVAGCLGLISLVVAALSLFIHRDTNDWKTIFFSLYVVLGSVFCFVAVLAFNTTPNSTFVCQSRVWLTAVGFSILLSGIFARSYQYYVIYGLGTNMSVSIDHAIVILKVLGTCLLPQFILLIVWTSYDPYLPVLVNFNTINDTASWKCDSNVFVVWIWMEVTYFLSLLVFGLWLFSVTWDLKGFFRDSKYIIVCIYNVIVTLCVVLTLYLSVEFTDDSIGAIASAAILFSAFTSNSTIFLPRLFRTIDKYVTAKVAAQPMTQQKLGSTGSESVENDRAPVTPLKQNYTPADERKASVSHYAAQSVLQKLVSVSNQSQEGNRVYGFSNLETAVKMDAQEPGKIN